MKLIDSDKVAALIREVAAEEVMPRFRNLAAHEISEKTKGDPVTDADLAAERRLTAGLAGLLPGSLVVGEEAVHADPKVLERLNGEAPVWLIDPVDGTKNFTEGSELFCVMVALVRGGETIGAWTYAPVADEMAMAELGGGASLNGAALCTDAALKDAAAMRGAVHTKYLDAPVRAQVEQTMGGFASNEQLYCSGLTYVRLATGALDHAVYWRANPWDHAMGALIVSEAGGRTAYFDGAVYVPDAGGKHGLISVRHKAAWPLVRDTLFPEGVPA